MRKSMRKSAFVILGSILILVMAGISNTMKGVNENAYKYVMSLDNSIGDCIEGKYIFQNIEERVYKNQKYLYDINDSIICYFNGKKTSAYLCREGKGEKLDLIREEYDPYGSGLKYIFKDKLDEKYSLYLSKADENNLHIKWVYPDKSFEEFTSKLISRCRCEREIKKLMNEFELNNLLVSDFKDSCDLQIDKIFSEINDAREAIYKKTKKDKKYNHYLYAAGNDYCKKKNGFELKYYIFNLVTLDKPGNITNKADDYVLVKYDDNSLYSYIPLSNGKENIEELVYEN